MTSEFDAGIATRKAIYIPFPQAVPAAYLVDESTCTYVQSNGKKCGACVKKCPKDCIDLDAQARSCRSRSATSSWPPATTCFDAHGIERYGYGKSTRTC